MKRVHPAALVLAIVALAAGTFLLATRDHGKRDTVSLPPAAIPPRDPPGFDGKNATFMIDGAAVTLVDGVCATPATPGSATTTITRYFGNEARGDLNGDGRPDIAFLVTRAGGGTGLFYYVVVALQTPHGYRTTNAFPVGDRIAPQATEIHADAGELHVNFAERRPGEPMTAAPSLGAVLLLKVTPEGVLEGLMR